MCWTPCARAWNGRNVRPNLPLVSYNPSMAPSSATLTRFAPGSSAPPQSDDAGVIFSSSTISGGLAENFSCETKAACELVADRGLHEVQRAWGTGRGGRHLHQYIQLQGLGREDHLHQFLRPFFLGRAHFHHPLLDSRPLRLSAGSCHAAVCGCVAWIYRCVDMRPVYTLACTSKSR